MGLRDLILDRELRGEEVRREKSLKRREERAELRRRLIEARTRNDLGPGTESIEEPESNDTGDEILEVHRGRPNLLSEFAHGYVAGSSTLDSMPVSVDPQLYMDPQLYRAVLNGDNHFIRGLTASTVPLAHAFELKLSPQENTVLHVAAISGSANIVETILGRWFHLFDAENSSGDTPLHLAARSGHSSTVMAIIKCVRQSSASSSEDTVPLELEYILTVKNNSGNNALQEALKNRHERVAKFLFDEEPKIWGSRNDENKSALYLAAEAGFLDLVNHIIDKIVTQENNLRLEGIPPGIAAIIARRTDILEVIKQLPPESSGSTDEFGRIPLHYAAWLGYVEGVVCLLTGESTVGACQRDVYGLSPLHVAATNGHVKVIEKLLEHCPYPEELLDRLRRNILHAAAEAGKENVVTYILRRPELESLINATDSEGRTPLHLATVSGQPKIVSILTKDKRIDMKAMTKQGYTALDIAVQGVENKYSFRRRLTWIALRAAGAPSAKFLNTMQQETELEIQKRWNSAARPSAKPSEDSYKNRVGLLQVVATLIAGMSFGAGFSLPGGYNKDGTGVPTLLTKWMFQAYVICATISLYSSITVVVALMWAQLGDVYLTRLVLNWASPLLGLALTMISFVFMSGVCLEMRKVSWLVILVFLIGVIFVLGIIILSVLLWFPHSSKCGILRKMSYHVFFVLLFVSGSSTEADDEDHLEGAYSAFSTR